MLANQHQFEDPQSISLKFTVKNLLQMKNTKEKLCQKKKQQNFDESNVRENKRT